MPEEQKEAADAIENAVAAVESEPPGHVIPEHAEHARLRKGDKLRSMAAVITALAALLAALGAFLKTFDHGVSKNVYDTLSESIVKLSDQQRRTQEDVAMLRGYLDGLSRAPMPATPITSSASASPPPTSATATVILTPIDAGAPIVARDAGHGHTLASLAGSPPPAVAPPAPPVRPPSFAAATSK